MVRKQDHQTRYTAELGYCEPSIFDISPFRLILFCETKRNETKYTGEGEKMLINLTTA